MDDTVRHTQHKNYILLYAFLILILGVVITVYVGGAIQFTDGTFEFRNKIKVSIGSGGTLFVFAILSGWVFYLGAKLEKELNMNDEVIFKTAMRHKNYILLYAFLILILGVAMTVYMQSILCLIVFAILFGWVFYLGTKLKVEITDFCGHKRIIEIRRIPRIPRGNGT